MKTVLVSGGFDPLHVGHVAYLREAAALGEVIVLLNSDAWLIRKKGYVFMPWAERRRVLAAVKYVSNVWNVDDRDDSVASGIRAFPKAKFFLNGGDRQEANPLEHEACEELGIKEVFDVGGPKIQSSSKLVGRLIHAM